MDYGLRVSVVTLQGWFSSGDCWPQQVHRALAGGTTQGWRVPLLLCHHDQGWYVLCMDVLYHNSWVPAQLSLLCAYWNRLNVSYWVNTLM